ncbi:MAG: hypothetical protein GC164_06210 [Phycisphaera sp.]|nr:hypothetical protein [Phycisphaera sp.]
MKWLVRIVLALVLLILVVGIVAYIYVDHIAKVGIEKGATYALGVDTTVGNVKIGLTSGQFAVNKLNIDNPAGFDAGDHFLNLDKAELNLPLSSLTKEKIVIPSLELSGIDMVLEKKGDSANYKVLMDNLKKLETGEKPAKPDPNKKSKQFVVENIVIKDVNVHAYLVQIGSAKPRPVDVHIDEILVKYDSEKGADINELSSLIMQTILTSVLQNAGNLLPGAIADGLGEGLKGLTGLADIGIEVTGQAAELVGNVVGEVGKTVGDVAKNLGDSTGEVGKALDGVGKGVGDVGKGITEGLGGLLGGNKNENKNESGEK